MNFTKYSPVAIGRFGASEAVTRPKVSVNLQVLRPCKRLCQPPLRKAAVMLSASGGQSSGKSTVKELIKNKIVMREIVIILSVFAIIASGCGQRNPKKQLEENIDTLVNDVNIVLSVSDFENYILTLDSISLPLEYHILYGKLPDISKKYDKQGFQRYNYGGWTNQPLGIFYKDNKTIGIIDYSIGDFGTAPFLTTYDFKGNKIDSTSFYAKSGWDMGYEAIEHLIFKENKTIIVLDTVKRWDFNEDETDILEGSMKLTTGKTEYRITDNRKIEKNEYKNANL